MTTSQVLDRQVEASFEDVGRFLSWPRAYPERTARVTVRETHISRVFLTDRFAYKLKKPVQFEFVDFSTIELRRRACEEEVRLNRRLAKQVYLGILPITRGPGGMLRLGGDGPAVDWVVKMRRLPEDRMLDQLIESGRLRPKDVDRLATVLAAYYHRAPPLVLQPERYRAELQRHVVANSDELRSAKHALPGSLVKRVHTAQHLFLRSSAELLDARVCDGRIIDGHGDLRPEHVCLDGTPVVFDCLEFSPELRRLDVLDELCFFAMECELLGADWVGQRVLEAYFAQSGDRPPQRLQWFYRCYRACVRAKVAALRSHQLEGREADDAAALAAAYLALADKYAMFLARPFVVVVRGLVGSGKTTVASRLADSLGVARLGTDDVRRDLFGASREPAAFNSGVYSPAIRARVYDELFARCERLLADGESGVLDGTFLRANDLEEAGRVTECHGACLLIVTCRCETNVARERIAARIAEGANSSEARPDFLEQQIAAFEPVPMNTAARELDTTHGLRSDGFSALFKCLAALAEPASKPE
jgi:aminoglycoside phosphotransferase family enzyme/predicted kinase